MGMPITVEIADAAATTEDLDAVFAYFRSVDEQFSPFKKTSEVSRMNDGLMTQEERSAAMREVLALSEETKKMTDGYFDIRKPDGTIDPSGLVKGWAILNAANLLKERGRENFCVEAGGDIQVDGRNVRGSIWTGGIRNPFQKDHIVKTVALDGKGIATSGTYIRGQHIYDPHHPEQPVTDIVSLTVIGPNVFEADRFATAAFAMGRKGITFIENLKGFEGYMIDVQGIATMTNGFASYVPLHARADR